MPASPAPSPRIKSERKYKQPVDNIQKTRAMRMINLVRWAIVRSAIQEEELNIREDPQGHQEFVHNHRRLQKHLAGHFPYIDIRGNQFASDIAHELAKDITFFILHGDTPGE